ncbi:uncharacterized protein L3040_008739 [Drepanopeziza brunnea f. sp. 'multigermtubi']|uniref:uncharacterized protein n=1 Tax=Drepanopeziza brunnea f. sp. 'multigermtubi' TaxID=698441 RepID=UPI0023A50EF0|nr:hypothetical protein L3040_008739 [Drepanopeziza brunnea f. sp. 'multigermtubi']
MAPRKPKAEDDAASTTSTDLPAVLKPKTEKAKVEKPKSEKPKVAKPKAPKKEKVENEEKEAKPKKKAVKKDKEEKDEDGDFDMDADAAVSKPAKAKTEGKAKVESKAVGGGGAVGKGDGKEKVKPVNGEEAMELIRAYLKRENRPYSATEISANLHGKVTKTVADKLLKDMEQSGQIKGKATKSGTGGQWVFWPIQDPADSASPEELAAMDTAIEALRERMPAIKASLKSLRAKLDALRTAPTTVDLAAAIERMQEENVAKKERLLAFQQGTVKTVTTEEVENVEKDLKYWGGKRTARKRAFEAVEGQLREGMTKEDIWDKAGIEEDTY